jgi:hypothetical protein
VSAAAPPTGKNRGWFVSLAVDERVITKAFGIGGLIVFSSYQPQISIVSGVCGKTGTSFLYTLYLTNGNPVLTDSSGNYSRYQTVDVFVAPPTIDSGSTKNAVNPNQRSAATLTAEQLSIMANLKALGPKNARYGNFYLVVNAMGSDTRYIGVAALPVPFIVHNWKQVQ